MGYKPVVIEGQKVCTKCRLWKPLNEFTFDAKPNRHRSCCKKCGRVYAKARWDADINGCVAKSRRQSIQYARKVKLLVISAYGGCCACCGESEPDFLTIDHINGDGADSRRRGEGSGTPLYGRLRRECFPKDRYQLLCFNCNCSKRQFGTCPHTRTNKYVAALITSKHVQ